MKIWVDDIRPAPDGYVWCYTTNEAICVITNISRLQDLTCKDNLPVIELIDLDHDAGDYVIFGGDYINILNFLEKCNLNYPIRIHSMNPIGVENMRRIIKKNGWREIK